MKHRRRYRYFLRQYSMQLLAVASIIVLLIIVLSLVDFSTSPSDNETFRLNESGVSDLIDREETVSSQSSDTDLLDDAEATRVSSSSSVGEDGLCEDYLFEEGTSLEIDDHEVIVSRISERAIIAFVDGEQYMIGRGDTDRYGDNLKIELGEDHIVYFGANDEANLVLLRIGCKADERPIDKLVEERGSNVCAALYRQCKESFDFEDE